MNNRLVEQANKGITIANHLASTFKVLRSGASWDEQIPDYKLGGIAKALREMEEELRKCRDKIENECTRIC